MTLPLLSSGFQSHCSCPFLRTLLLPSEQAQISLLVSERSFEGQPLFSVLQIVALLDTVLQIVALLELTAPSQFLANHTYWIPTETRTMQQTNTPVTTLNVYCFKSLNSRWTCYAAIAS